MASLCGPKSWNGPQARTIIGCFVALAYFWKMSKSHNLPARRSIWRTKQASTVQTSKILWPMTKHVCLGISFQSGRAMSPTTNWMTLSRASAKATWTRSLRRSWSWWMQIWRQQIFGSFNRLQVNGCRFQVLWLQMPHSRLRKPKKKLNSICSRAGLLKK